MWSIVTQAIGTIFGSWVDLKKAKYEAQTAKFTMQAKIEGDWDQESLRQSQYSWKDELITLIMFAPFVVAWFDEDRASAWIEFISGLPYWYQIIVIGIVAASFGLRWFFKNKFANGFKQ